MCGESASDPSVFSVDTGCWMLGSGPALRVLVLVKKVVRRRKKRARAEKSAGKFFRREWIDCLSPPFGEAVVIGGQFTKIARAGCRQHVRRASSAGRRCALPGKGPICVPLYYIWSAEGTLVKRNVR